MKDRKYIYHVDDFAEIPEGAGLNALLSRAFDPLEGSGADTLVFCMGTNNAEYYASSVTGRDGDVEGFNFRQYSTAIMSDMCEGLLNDGVNVMQAIIDEGHRRGYDIFLDFRLNDQHDHWDHCSDTLPKFKVENPHLLNPKEYFPDYAGVCEMTTAFDFTRHEVRDFKLRMLREMLEIAEFDGAELDFMRTQTYYRWDKGYMYAHYMTDFMMRVKELVREISEKRGKPMEIAARVCTTPEGCRVAGFDVREWAKRGLVDFIIAGTGGLYIDTLGFKQLLSGTGVKFYPCHYGDYERVVTSPETARGIAETLYMDEPDGLYVFNFYPVQNNRIEVVGQMSRPERLKGLDKTYIVDVNYDYNPLTNEEWRFAHNLPAVLDRSDEWLELPIRVGEDLGAYDGVKAELMLFIQNHSIKDEIEYMWNGAPLTSPPRLEMSAPGHMQHYMYFVIDPRSIKRENTFAIRLRSQNPKLAKYSRVSLERVNLMVKFPK